MNKLLPQGLTAAAAVGLLLVAVPASAQIKKREVIRQPANPAPAVERSQSTTTTRTSANVQVNKFSTVMKSKVVLQEDYAAGQVVDFVLADSGCVDYIVATHQNQYYLIPYSAVEFRWKESVVFVDITSAQFKKVTFFSANNWPDITAADFRDEVFSTFNVSATRRDSARTTRRDVDVDVDRRDRDVDVNRRDSDRDRRDSDRDRRDRPQRDDATPDRSKKDDQPDRNAPREKADQDLKPPPKPEPKADDKKPAPRDDDKKPAPKAEDDKKPAPTPRDDEKKPAPKADDDKKPAPAPRADDKKPIPPAPAPRDKEPKSN